MKTYLRVVRSVVVVLVLVAPPSAAAQAPASVTRLTREDAVALALRGSPTLRAKGLEVRASQANEVTAGLRPNPTASYAADQLGGRTTDPQYTVSVGQTIETGGKRERRVASARAATRVVGYELDDVRRQVVALVKKAFTDVLVAQATLALAQENLKSIDEVERLQRLRAERGDISELELLRIQVQRFAFERDASDARLAIAAAKITLRQVVGGSGVDSQFEVVGDLDFREIVPSRDDLYRRALDNRPDLRAAEATRARARADNDLAHANAWWDVTPQISYQRIGPDNTIGVGVSVPLRIFDRNQGEIARTRAEIDRTDALREVARAQVLADVDGALSVLTIQRERVVVLRGTYLPKAQQARDTVGFAYQRGGVSLLDFLDAQRTYRETALEHLRALGNYWGAFYQLEAAAGGGVEP